MAATLSFLFSSQLFTITYLYTKCLAYFRKLFFEGIGKINTASNYTALTQYLAVAFGFA